MITRSRNPGEPVPTWKRELANAFTDPAALLAYLDLDDLVGAGDGGADTVFPLRVPLSFVPLLLQVLPRAREMLPVAGFVSDPVEDRAALQRYGLIRKYHGRGLLVSTGACAIHCRYCFRRHFPYSEQGFRRDQAELLRQQVAADGTLAEVILSGGDPLSLSDARLGNLLDLLAGFDHVKRLRIHTRLPVVLPSRICASFLRMLAEPRDVQLVMVLHINHAQEIDPQVEAALKPLGALGITLLNQAVMLKGVNDSSTAQIALAEACFAVGVMPYYLHLLDPVDGAAHFEVDEATAAGIAEELRRRLPGYLVPRLVRETPGSASKTPVFGVA